MFLFSEGFSQLTVEDGEELFSGIVDFRSDIFRLDDFDLAVEKLVDSFEVGDFDIREIHLQLAGALDVEDRIGIAVEHPEIADFKLLLGIFAGGQTEAADGIRFEPGIFQGVDCIFCAENILTEDAFGVDVFVMVFRSVDVADRGGTADGGKVFDKNLAGFVGTDGIVSAFDGSDIFKNDVAAVAVEIVTVIVEVFDDDITDGDVAAVFSYINTGNTIEAGFFKTGFSRSFCSFGKADDIFLIVNLSASFIFCRFSADDGPFAGLKLLKFFEFAAAFGFVEAPHAVNFSTERHEIAIGHIGADFADTLEISGLELLPLFEIQRQSAKEDVVHAVNGDRFAGFAALAAEDDGIADRLVAGQNIDGVAGFGFVESAGKNIQRGGLGAGIFAFAVVVVNVDVGGTERNAECQNCCEREEIFHFLPVFLL